MELNTGLTLLCFAAGTFFMRAVWTLYIQITATQHIASMTEGNKDAETQLIESFEEALDIREAIEKECNESDEFWEWSVGEYDELLSDVAPTRLGTSRRIISSAIAKQDQALSIVEVEVANLEVHQQSMLAAVEDTTTAVIRSKKAAAVAQNASNQVSGAARGIDDSCASLSNDEGNFEALCNKHCGGSSAATGPRIGGQNRQW